MAVQRAAFPGGAALTPRARLAAILGLAPAAPAPAVRRNATRTAARRAPAPDAAPRTPARARISQAAPLPRTGAVPRSRAAVPIRTGGGAAVAVLPGIRAAGRALPRPRRAFSIAATMLAITLLGLIQLTQTLAIAGDRYAIDTLLMEREVLLRTVRSQAGLVAQRGAETEIVRWGLDDGLGRIVQTIRVPAP